MKNIKFLLASIIAYSLFAHASFLNATMYIENKDFAYDASGKPIPGSGPTDLKNVKVHCWNGGNWGPGTLVANHYLEHDCGNGDYLDITDNENHAFNSSGVKRGFAPADVYYNNGEVIGTQWESSNRWNTEYDNGRDLRRVVRGTFDSRGNSHYCLRMVGGKVNVLYNGTYNCPTADVNLNLGNYLKTHFCRYCYLPNVNLSNGDLRNSNLEGANLTGATIVHSALMNSNLKYANFYRTNLTNTDLSGADLTGAINLNTANLTGTILTRAIMPDGSRHP